MAIKQQGRISGPEGILHHDYSNVLDVKINIFIVVERICRAYTRGCRGRGQWENLVVPMLIQGMSIGKEQIPGMDIFLD
jgi:hypothetical protein